MLKVQLAKQELVNMLNLFMLDEARLALVLS